MILARTLAMTCSRSGYLNTKPQQRWQTESASSLVKKTTLFHACKIALPKGSGNANFMGVILSCTLTNQWVNILQTLSTAAQRNAPAGAFLSMAKLVYLTESEWHSRLLLQDPIGAVKKSLRAWLKKKIGRERLHPEFWVYSGPWRTEEHLIPKDG